MRFLFVTVSCVLQQLLGRDLVDDWKVMGVSGLYSFPHLQAHAEVSSFVREQAFDRMAQYNTKQDEALLRKVHGGCYVEGDQVLVSVFLFFYAVGYGASFFRY